MSSGKAALQRYIAARLTGSGGAAIAASRRCGILSWGSTIRLDGKRRTGVVDLGVLAKRESQPYLLLEPPFFRSQADYSLSRA